MANFITVNTITPEGEKEDVLMLQNFSGYAYRFVDVITIPGIYTFSIWVKAESACTVSFYILGIRFDANVTTEWQKLVFTTMESTTTYIDICPDTNISVYFYKGMLQSGNKDTDWKPSPDDVESEIEEASKVATNFMKFEENVGLIIGDLTAGTLGKNALIDSIGYYIRDSETVLAEFQESLISLGKNSKETIIDFCNGAGQIHNNLDTANSYNRLTIESDDSIEMETQGGIYLNAEHTGDSIQARTWIELENYAPWKADCEDGVVEIGAFRSNISGSNTREARLLIEPSHIGILMSYLGNTKELLSMYMTSDSEEGRIYVNEPLCLSNSNPLMGKDASGNEIEILRISTNETPLILIGDGLYKSGVGDVNIGSGTNIRLITTNERVILENVEGTTITSNFRPNNNNKCSLGTSSKKWNVIYAGNATIQTSDEREKENIIPMNQQAMTLALDDEPQVDIYSEIFDRLNPVQYNFVGGNGRTCYGLIAQQVIQILEEIGIGENDLDLLHHDYYTDEETGEQKDAYGIAYANIIPLLIHEVQKLKAKVG